MHFAARESQKSYFCQSSASSCIDVLYREPAGRPAIHIVDAPTANSLLSQDEAIEVVRQCFADLDSGISIGFPPLSGHGSDNGRSRGRSSDDAITIYDSSGISLQDLAVAGYVFEKALAAGLTQFVDV